MKRSFILFFALATPVSAGDLENHWQTSALSKSSRLLAFSLANHPRPDGADAYLMSFLRKDGQLHQAGVGPQLVYSKLALKPLLSFDPNINNGLPASEIAIGGLQFQVSDDAQAKAGYMIGGQVLGTRQWSIGEGQVFKLSGSMTYRYSPEYRLDSKAARGEACIASHAAQWLWFDYCAGATYAEKKSAAAEKFVSISGERIFGSNLGDHSLGIGIKKAFREDYSKTSVSFSLLSSIPGVGAIGVGYSFGEHVEGQNTMLRSANFSVTRPLFQRASTVTMSYRENGGSYFFGAERSDEIVSVSLSTEVADSIGVTLGYQVTASTVEAYEHDHFFLGFDFMEVGL